MKSVALYDEDTSIFVASRVKDCSENGFTDVQAGIALVVGGTVAHLNLNVYGTKTVPETLEAELEALDRLTAHIVALRHELLTVTTPHLDPQ